MIPSLLVSNHGALAFDGKSEPQVEDANMTRSASFSERYVTALDAEKVFIESSQTFDFETNAEITNVSESEGASWIASSVFGDGMVEVTLCGFADLETAKISFFSGDELVDVCALYIAKDEDGAFHSSAISMDTAKRSAGQELNYSIADENDSAKKEGDNDSSIALASIGASGRVLGTLKWTDEQGNAHPLIGAKVKVTMDGSWWSEETYTSITGYYSISYDDIWYLGSGKPTVHIYSEGENVEVTNGGVYEHSHEFSSTAGGPYSYTFSPNDDGDMGKAMMVFQGAKNFSDYAVESYDNNSISSCEFMYPANSKKGASYSNGVVYVGNMENGDSSHYPSTYAAWDIIGHEYGHHIQKCFGISDSPGGEHYAESNEIDHQYKNGYSLKEAKDRGYKLSWAEGWSTYWSTVAQTSFSNDLKTIETVGDLRYSAETFEYGLDVYSADSKGDADETAIQRILYKLCSEKQDDYDRFSLGEDTLWKIVSENKPFTFYEFVDDLYSQGYDKNDLGRLLGKYNVVPCSIEIKDNAFDRLPTFTWDTYMGSSNLRFDDFDLYFEDESGQAISTVEGISSSGTSASCTVSADIWQRIYDASGDSFYAYFVARQTDYFTSGNYYSEKIMFEKPTGFSASKVQVKPNEWGFPGRYYFQNEIESDESVRFSVFAKDGLTIITDRLRCGYIEDSYINLSPRREDAGLAYFQMEFDRPVYSFMYSICLWSVSENLDGTAVLKIKNQEGEWSALTDLLNDITLAYRESSGCERHAHYFPSGISGIRFEATATATGGRNKGRLCIDDLVFGTEEDMAENLYIITDYGKTSG